MIFLNWKISCKNKQVDNILLCLLVFSVKKKAPEKKIQKKVSVKTFFQMPVSLSLNASSFI